MLRTIAVAVLALLAGSTGLSCASSSDRDGGARSSTPQMSEEETREWRRAWQLYVADDPGWPAARQRWVADGESATVLLVENLVADLILASDAGLTQRVTRARVELVALGDRSVPYLVEALRHGDNVTRRHCGDVLVEIGPSVLTPLAQRIGDLPPDGRIEVAAILGRVEDPRAVDVLGRICESDVDWRVRGAAVEALATYLPAEAADRRMTASLTGDADPYVRRSAAQLLSVASGETSRRALVTALGDADRAVRTTAARSLGLRRDPEAVSGLVAALRRELAGDPVDVVVAQALREALVSSTGVDHGLDPDAWSEVSNRDE